MSADHLHCVWRLPEGDDDFSERWRQIKRYFSIGLGAELTGPGDWKFGSFAQAVGKGWYPQDWGRSEPVSIKGMDPE
ncbi:MAG: hypothetical protein HYU77_14915 [Betaproteobacteria bacterium]|nr:hypothetical protein [Betaproteobacteria bacterium]